MHQKNQLSESNINPKFVANYNAYNFKFYKNSNSNGNNLEHEDDKYLKKYLNSKEQLVQSVQLKNIQERFNQINAK